MSVHSAIFQLKTQGFGDTLDLTSLARQALEQSGIRDGLCNVFVPGSTAGITTIEFESGVLEDFRLAFEKIASRDSEYHHNKRWGDGNGFSHVRAALLGPSLSVPVTEGQLVLGTWQQIVLVDFDNGPRKRSIHFHILGDS